MRKVITVNLNGNAYQLEEEAYERLRRYLDDASAALQGNVDRAEVLADLEQAIADKCDTCLGGHRTVVSEAEMEQVLREMGPVETPDGAQGPAPASAAAGSGTRARRLYRLPAEGMLGGVCAGLAAYFTVDVAWMRLAFLLLVFFTGGMWLLAWLAMLFVMPAANTPEEIATAHGEPLNAREVLERAKKKSSEFARQAGARMQRDWQRFEPGLKRAGDQVSASFSAGMAQAGENVRELSHRLRERARRRAASRQRHERAVSPGTRLAASLSLPFLSIISAALFVAFVFAAVTLLTQGHVLGLHPVYPVPLWAAVAGLAVLYLAVGGPVGVARRLSQRCANGGSTLGWASATDTLFWVLLVVLFFYLGALHLPEMSAWLHQLLPVRHSVFI